MGRGSALLVVVSLAAVGLLALRIAVAGNESFGFLAWNLALALVPLGLSSLAVRLVARDGSRLAVAAAAAAWLAFFPNAPYVVTDFVHLGEFRGAPLALDVVLVAAFAAAGLLAGYLSLRQVHGLVRRRVGRVGGWAAVVAVLFASGVAIYLGRVVQLNSWDLVAAPLHVVRATADALGHGGSAARVVGTWAVLLAGYAVVCARAEQRAERAQAELGAERQRGAGRQHAPARGDGSVGA